MAKIITSVNTVAPLQSDMHHAYISGIAGSKKQSSAVHIEAAMQLKDATKLGTILKKVGGGFSRSRP